MMDYAAAFAISASGLQVAKLRVDVTAVNLANAYSTRSADGRLFEPLQVVAAAKRADLFRAALDGAQPALQGAEVVEVRPTHVPPRLVFEPHHPDADAKGFVAYPGIDPVAEMVNLVAATRIYEANVAALNAAKSMATKALELGGQS
jgi:flagellar basal-body rod protein FlgC